MFNQLTPITQNINDMETPQEFDVLFGRGKPFQRHPGNLRMLTIVKRNRNRYQSSCKSDKPKIARQVIQEIQNFHPPIRFLKRLNRNEEGENILAQRWYQPTNDEVYHKITHGLRAKQPIKMIKQIHTSGCKQPQLVMSTNHSRQSLKHLNIMPQSNLFQVESEHLESNGSKEIKTEHAPFGPSQSFNTNNHAHESIELSSTKTSLHTCNDSIDTSHIGRSTEAVHEKEKTHMIQLMNLGTNIYCRDHLTLPSDVHRWDVPPSANNEKSIYETIEIQKDQKPSTHHNFDTQNFRPAVLSGCTMQVSNIEPSSSNQRVQIGDQVELRISPHASQTFIVDANHNEICSPSDMILQSLNATMPKTAPHTNESIATANSLDPLRIFPPTTSSQEFTLPMNSTVQK